MYIIDFIKVLNIVKNEKLLFLLVDFSFDSNFDLFVIVRRNRIDCMF